MIRRLEEQLKQLQAAKEELEQRQNELQAMMGRLEESKNMEAVERAKLEEEIKMKQDEVLRIQNEVDAKDQETRRLQVFSIVVVDCVRYVVKDEVHGQNTQRLCVLMKHYYLKVSHLISKMFKSCIIMLVLVFIVSVNYAFLSSCFLNVFL